MTYALGDVIAQIGGYGGGGGPVPSRHVYDLGGQPIPTSGEIFQAIDANPGDMVAATLEWDGPESWALAVSLTGSMGATAVGMSTPWPGGGLIPVSVVEVQREGYTPGITIRAAEGGYAATRLTVIVIPKIEDAQ